MTEARTTQASAIVAIEGAPKNVVTQLPAQVALAARPHAQITQLSTLTAKVLTNPPVFVDQICVQVILLNQVRQAYQAVWIE